MMSEQPKKKVIILGAGASMDFGFPSGMRLMQEIYLLWLRPDHNMTQCYEYILKKLGKTPKKDFKNDIQNLSYKLFYSGAKSIDEFLSLDRIEDEYKVLGKITILKCILEAETRASYLENSYVEDKNYEDRVKCLFRLRKNWLREFFAKEFGFLKHEELTNKLSNNYLRFITFNYDRCLESFLFKAFKNYYALSDQETKDVMDLIKVEHVYGSLAPLDWQANEKSWEFGQEVEFVPQNFDMFFEKHENIKVVGEERVDASKDKDILKEVNKEKPEVFEYKDIIKAADKVYILGFGFNDTNWGLLGINEYQKEFEDRNKFPFGKFVYTVSGLSDDRKEIFRVFFSTLYTSSTCVDNKKIYDYVLNHY